MLGKKVNRIWYTPTNNVKGCNNIIDPKNKYFFQCELGSVVSVVRGGSVEAISVDRLETFDRIMFEGTRYVVIQKLYNVDRVENSTRFISED